MIFAIYDTLTGRVTGWREPKNVSLAEMNEALAVLGRAAVDADARIDGPCKVVNGTIVPLPVDADAIAARQVRSERNYRLVASDWTQVPDAPVDQTAWAAYRQALRDVPQQDGFPYNITWPEVPA